MTARAVVTRAQDRLNKPRPLERDIKALCADYLALMGWHVVDTEANAVRAGTTGKRGVVAPGEPDTRAFKGNRAIHIEYKRPLENLRPVQVTRHQYLAEFGIRVHIVRSLEDLKGVLMIEAALETKPEGKPA